MKPTIDPATGQWRDASSLAVLDLARLYHEQPEDALRIADASRKAYEAAAYEALSGEGWYEPIDPVIEQNRLMGGLLGKITGEAA